MKVNLHSPSLRNDGFGVAGRQIKKSIETITPSIVAEREVDLYFNHPIDLELDKSNYSIIYFPWESTAPREGWVDNLKKFDEIWVTSPWVRSVVQDWGFDSYVYEHGLNPVWHSALRESPVSGPFKFLMIGFEAARKGGWEAIHAFRKAFGSDPSVELVIKTKSTGMANVNVFNNIRFVTEDLSLHDMIRLYHECQVMVAPTYGEGFGIPARDAIGTGMPLIATSGFLPYERLMHKDLLIPSTLVDSPWPDLHPGKMYQPDVDSLVDQMTDVLENFNYYSRLAAYESKYVHLNYTWDHLTEDTFFALGSRLE